MLDVFQALYGTAAEAALTPTGWEPYVVVQPSYKTASDIIVMAYAQKDTRSRVFIYYDRYKAWQLRFDNLPELAGELLRRRQVIEQAATRAILGYHLAQTVIEVMGQTFAEPNPMKDQVKAQSLLAFSDGVALVVTNLNGLISLIVNEEVTEADFDDDLTALFAKLSEVEGTVNELEDLFEV